MAYKDHSPLEGTDKDTWRRSEHILNLITAAQCDILDGENLQSPWMISKGVYSLKTIIVPLLSEIVKETYEETNEEGKTTIKTRNIKLRGLETQKGIRYEAAFSAARNLLQAAIDRKISNHKECENVAYQVLTELSQELLQDVEDFGLNFRNVQDPTKAYKSGNP